MGDELSQSPLRESHLAAGAKLTEFGGWEMPLSYPLGTVAEHKKCRTDAVMFDVSHLGTVRVEGAGSFELLQRTLTNDLAKINPGRAQYTHLLDENTAGVVDDIIVWWVGEDRFDVMPNASNTSGVLSAIGGNDVTSERAIIAVQGPSARVKVARISQTVRDVPRFSVVSTEWNGVPLVVAGTGYTGEDGFEIAVPAADADKLWLALTECEIAPAGLGARDTLRLEAGLPLHGHELGLGITPLQAGLSWVIGWDKPAFRGKAMLEAERAAGPSRRLRGLIGHGRQPLRGDEQVTLNEAAAGVTSSGNYSPMLERGIALAFVDPTLEMGTVLEVAVRGRTAPASICPLPFVKAGQFASQGSQ